MSIPEAVVEAAAVYRTASPHAELARLRERNAELEKERDALIAALKDIAGEK